MTRVRICLRVFVSVAVYVSDETTRVSHKVALAQPLRRGSKLVFSASGGRENAERCVHREFAIYQILSVWKKHAIMKLTNSPTQGQPDPRKIR